MSYKLIPIAQDETGVRFKIEENNKLLTFQEVFDNWAGNEAFSLFYIKALVGLGFEEFFWEHPAVNTAYLSKPYECIILKSKRFATRQVNEKAFADYIYTDNKAVVFSNLGKNAKLVVPTKLSDPDIYRNIGFFIKYAELSQVQEQFKKVGETVLDEIEAGKLIWLNTAGAAVIWLHIRLDTKPKYYKTKPYKTPNFLHSSKN